MSGRRSQAELERLRAVPLAAILQRWGSRPDPCDPHKWHTPRGTLSINGPKFMNWTSGVGGGGAIDLVLHLSQAGFTQALHWLEGHFPGSIPALVPELPPRPKLQLPSAQPSHLERLKRYLVIQRALPGHLVEALIQSGSLYADQRANAVFLLRGTDHIPVGAELRGTGLHPWRGLAPGSQKNLGWFSVPAAPALPPKGVVLCESAIDAISCSVIYPQHYCLSTAGARPNPRWLPSLLDSGSQVYCGFDTDSAGEAMAQAMISLYPTVQRLRPHHHDWNEVLQSLR